MLRVAWRQCDTRDTMDEPKASKLTTAATIGFQKIDLLVRCDGHESRWNSLKHFSRCSRTDTTT